VLEPWKIYKERRKEFLLQSPRMASFDRLLVLLEFTFIFISICVNIGIHCIQITFNAMFFYISPFFLHWLHNIVWLSFHHVLMNKKIVIQPCCGVSCCSVKGFSSIYQCNLNTLFPLIPPKDWHRLKKLRLLKLPKEVQDALLQK